MFGSLFGAAGLPDKAIEYAGFVLTHCAAIADANRGVELICPFAVITSSNGREVLDFESETQEEAVSKGWASFAEAKRRRDWWAFGREGIYRDPDGTASDVLTVTVWTPQMKFHHSFTQRFGRRPDQGICLFGGTELVKHAGEYAEPVERWSQSALLRGINSHPQGARWQEWSRSDA
jgi:hypothetical protein